jgi:hypothetical protein
MPTETTPETGVTGSQRPLWRTREGGPPRHPTNLAQEARSQLTISARAEMTFPRVVKDLLMLAPSCVQRRWSGHQEVSGASCCRVVPWDPTRVAPSSDADSGPLGAGDTVAGSPSKALPGWGMQLASISS